jgi:hypothetical protein
LEAESRRGKLAELYERLDGLASPVSNK